MTPVWMLVARSTLSSAREPAGPPVDTGVTAWMRTSTALVLLMVPGFAMPYGGHVRTKNALGTMMHAFAAMVIIGVMWIVCGHATAFGPNAFRGRVGRFGFDAGSSIQRGLATAQALTATRAAAAAGGLGWILIERLFHRKATSLGIASGILAGPVAIPPAARDRPDRRGRERSSDLDAPRSPRSRSPDTPEPGDQVLDRVSPHKTRLGRSRPAYDES